MRFINTAVYSRELLDHGRTRSSSARLDRNVLCESFEKPASGEIIHSHALVLKLQSTTSNTLTYGQSLSFPRRRKAHSFAVDERSEIQVQLCFELCAPQTCGKTSGCGSARARKTYKQVHGLKAWSDHPGSHLLGGDLARGAWPNIFPFQVPRRRLSIFNFSSSSLLCMSRHIYNNPCSVFSSR